jgi:hypothetical protein
VSSNLEFRCPHCEHKYEDELELLDNEIQHDFKCEHCAKPFVVLTKECQACASESTFVWPTVPSEAILMELQCYTCGTLLQATDEIEDE